MENITKFLSILRDILYKEYTFKIRKGLFKVKGRIYSTGKLTFSIVSNENNEIIIRFTDEQPMFDVSFLKIDGKVDFVKIDEAGEKVTVKLAGNASALKGEVVIDLKELLDGEKE